LIDNFFAMAIAEPLALRVLAENNFTVLQKSEIQM